MTTEPINLKVTDLDLENLKESIIKQINDLSTDDLVNLNNAYCSSCNLCDKEIYNNDEEFFNTFFEGRPMEVARSIYYGNYRFMDEYVKFNGYGNIESLNSYEIAADNLAGSIDEITDYVIENQQEFNHILDFSESE